MSHDADAPASGPTPHPTRKKAIPAPFVFWPALILLVVVVLIAIAFPGATDSVLSAMGTGVVSGLSWYYMAVVAAFVIFAVWMGVSRFGNIKLGKDEEDADFGLVSWFAMLFAAGMGIGLVFWGAAEPLTYFASPKPGVDGSKALLAREAMDQTFFHWGFHPWAIYAVVGLSLAYAIHRRGRPASFRWALEPLFGERIKGGIGDLIDVIAVIGTLFGVATSLGLGVQQISAGLAHLGVVGEPTTTLQVVLIIVITLMATVSVVTGVDKGIKWLSNINLGLAGVFMISILLLGPTLYLLRVLVESVGSYLASVIPLTFDTIPYQGAEGLGFQEDWTIFYWGWWMAWAPFVGMFIARISRGRTVREFIFGVLLVPVMVSLIWFSVLGGTAIRTAWDDFVGGLYDPDEGVVSETVLFNLLESLPGGTVLAVVAVLLVAIFFITSSDSGSFVVDMLTSGGDTNPPKWSRVMWAGLEGLVAIALMIAGGLSALQTGSILTAVPVSVVIILMCISTFKALSSEHQVLVRAERRQRQRELQRELKHGITGDLEENFDDHFGEQVDDRIHNTIQDDYGVRPNRRS